MRRTERFPRFQTARTHLCGIVVRNRSGVSVLCFPAENKKGFDELPDYLKEGLEAHFCETYADVFDVAFCEDRFMED